MCGHYYKFRSLQNLRWFIDIIMNERLFASRYSKLNDPMEGVFITNEGCRHILDLLKTKKYKTRICSLSNNCLDNRLWSYYADSHKGCCIEVSPKNKTIQPEEMHYVISLPNIYEDVDGTVLLSHKSKQWEFEDEVRFFTKRCWFNVIIHRVIFGIRVSKQDYNFYSDLISRINPKIDVCQLKEENIEDGFEEWC